MALKHLIIEDKGHTRIITVNRPKVLNALNKKLLLEFLSVMLDIKNHKHLRCVIITGSGEKSFIAGADINEIKSFSPLDAEKFSSIGHGVMDAIGNAKVPVIAAVNGYALGGGLEIALACDFIYASENASFGLVETKLGLIPGFGGIARLPRRVGLAYAKEMVFSGAHLNAMEALRIGLVNRVVSNGEVLESARNLADKISERGPYAVSLAKKLLNESQDAPMSAMSRLESTGFGLVFSSSDRKEGINAFLEKRNVKFEGF